MTTNPNSQPAAERASDRQLDLLLAAARQPELPPGAQERLAQRLAAAPGPLRVIARTARDDAQGWSLTWLAGLPLAASLALGIYLGAAGSLDSILPTSLTGQTASADSGDFSDFSGMTDAEAEAAAGLT